MQDFSYWFYDQGAVAYWCYDQGTRIRRTKAGLQRGTGQRLAAAAAYLLCILLKPSPEPDSNRLNDNAHALRLVLLTVLLVALLVVLVAAPASPRGFDVFLLGLAICCPGTGAGGSSRRASSL